MLLLLVRNIVRVRVCVVVYLHRVAWCVCVVVFWQRIRAGGVVVLLLIGNTLVLCCCVYWLLFFYIEYPQGYSRVSSRVLPEPVARLGASGIVQRLQACLAVALGI